MREQIIKVALICALLGLFTYEPSYAQKTTGLAPLIQEALKNNPEIKAARAGWQASTKRPSQVGSLPNPTIGGRFKNVGFNEITRGEDPRTDIQIFLSQEIPFPGKLALKAKGATELSEAQGWVLEATTTRVVAELTDAFYEWSLVWKSIEITEENKKLVESFVDITEKLYEVGEGIQQDAVKAQVELSAILENLELLERRKEIVEARLRAILNRPPTAQLGIPEEREMSKLAISYTELEDMIELTAPRLKVRKNIIESKEEDLKLAKRQYYPDFVVEGTYFNRDGGDGNLRDIWQVGLGLRVPLYFWRKERFGVLEASSDLLQAQENYDATKNTLSFEAAKEYAKLRSAERLVSLYKDGIIPQSQLALESALTGYRVGKVDFLTLLDNTKTLFDFEIEYWRRRAEYEQALASLEDITGTNLTDKTTDSGGN